MEHQVGPDNERYGNRKAEQEKRNLREGGERREEGRKRRTVLNRVNNVVLNRERLWRMNGDGGIGATPTGPSHKHEEVNGVPIYCRI